MLLERRRELLHEIQSKVRDVRELGSNNRHHSADLRETVEADPEDDLAFALIQMRAETLENVNEAIRRFDDGTYGYCVDCNEVIASSRLRAMPFAVRCRDCAETLENEQHRARVHLQRSPSEFDSRH
jgi:DnaK suppressor protein